MKLSSLISTATAGLCLVLSGWLFVSSQSTQNLQGELQKQQDSLQLQQQEVQLQQQKLQTQQEQLNSATQLAQQVGPSVLRDLGTQAVENKNDKIKQLLSKYGVEIKEQPAKDAPSTPATTPAAGTKPPTH